MDAKAPVHLVRRWLRRLKLWLAMQAMPVMHPKLHKMMRYSERHIRDANELIRRRRGMGPD